MMPIAAGKGLGGSTDQLCIKSAPDSVLNKWANQLEDVDWGPESINKIIQKRKLHWCWNNSI